MTGPARLVIPWIALTGCADIFGLERPQLINEGAGAGGEVIGVPDGGGAAEPDASEDPVTLLYTRRTFPSPYNTLEDFTATSLAYYGVTGYGFYCCANGTLAGNLDAPLASPYLQAYDEYDKIEFDFPWAIRSVGISVTDADYLYSSPVIVTLMGLNNGIPVALHARLIVPAYTSQDSETGAVFVGLRSITPFTRVRITIDTYNTTLLDNLVFAY
jgi:hypothetical protein